MKRITRKDVALLMMQLAVWALIILIPFVATYIATMRASAAWGLLHMLFINLHVPFILYFLNFYVLWPWLFTRKRYWAFVAVNIIAVLGLNFQLFRFKDYADQAGIDLPDQAWIGVISGFIVYFLLNAAAIAAAAALRHFLRTRQIRQQLQEERHKNTEAELAWLKNQINPHFLFNTLNNISSLTQIDADAAQDAIAQLSDLLRYAIYRTDQPSVPIEGEVEFMRNYIQLMQLRCNEKTTVQTRFDIADPHSPIAPLLFISLIENAFKHGVSSNRPSLIDIRLTQEATTLTFRCDNTNFPKSDTDRSGSGIGLENTRRRLDLLYCGRYTWEQDIEGDIYHTQITIHT